MNEFMKENEVIGEVRAPVEHASLAEENKPDTTEKKPENRPANKSQAIKQ